MPGLCIREEAREEQRTARRQAWALNHSQQIMKIARAVCEVNTHGKVPCSECFESAREFFVAATFKADR